MARNPNHRRGTRRKYQVKDNPQSLPHNLPQDISDNGQTPYLDAFVQWCEVQQLSQQTIKQRKAGITRWIAWCDERGLDDPKAITRPILERYQQHLFYYRKANGEPLAIRSQLSLLHPLRAWFKWLSKQQHILYNPASELELPKLPPRLPQVILSVEEVEHLLSLPKLDCPYGLRDKAVLETLYSTGIRKSECIQLNIHDIDIPRRTLMIRQGKGGKDRVLPLSERLQHWLLQYLQIARPQILTNHHQHTLFLSDHGEALIKQRLTDLVKRYLYHAKIDKPGACHLFRHAMATHMLDNGADLRFIQSMLGHKDLSTTEIYTHVSIEKLREIHAATHPAKLEKGEALMNRRSDNEIWL